MSENRNALIDEAERLSRIVALPEGDLVLCCDSCGRCWPDDHAALSESCTCSRFKQRMEWATDRDVLQDFGKVLDKLAAELATTKADLNNEREVRSRRELAVTRAIAKAKLYMHPGTNAGDHKVLSEMVEILEGTNMKGE